MKTILILALISFAFATLTVDITYNDACTTQTAAVSANDASSADYAFWMADCPSSIASPADDAELGCEYYAQYFYVSETSVPLRRSLQTTYAIEAYVTDIAAPAGTKTLNDYDTSGEGQVEDTDCTVVGTPAEASYAMTCTWTVTATNTFWATAPTTTWTGTLADASFSQSLCGDGSSAVAFASISSAVLLF